MVSYFKVTLELEKGRKEGRIEECIWTHQSSTHYGVAWKIRSCWYWQWRLSWLKRSKQIRIQTNIFSFLLRLKMLSAKKCQIKSSTNFSWRLTPTQMEVLNGMSLWTTCCLKTKLFQIWRLNTLNMSKARNLTLHLVIQRPHTRRI